MYVIYIAVILYEISGKKQKLKLNVKKSTLPTERALLYGSVLHKKVRSTTLRVCTLLSETCMLN